MTSPSSAVVVVVVTVDIHNGLPQGDNLSLPPVKDCKEMKLTSSPA